MGRLVIYGKSHLDIIKLIDAINRYSHTWDVLGFLDDRKETHGMSAMGYPVLGGREIIPDLIRDNNTCIFSNVSGNLLKAQSIAEILDSSKAKIPNLIHPIIDMNYVMIGRGCILPEGCVIGGNVRIGNFLTARLKVLISHDVFIDDFVFIGPGVTIGSFAVIEKGAYIGAGATIMRRMVIGQNSVIGAGALVTRDVPANETVAGVPAKKILRQGQ